MAQPLAIWHSLLPAVQLQMPKELARQLAQIESYSVVAKTILDELSGTKLYEQFKAASTLAAIEKLKLALGFGPSPKAVQMYLSDMEQVYRQLAEHLLAELERVPSEVAKVGLLEQLLSLLGA